MPSRADIEAATPYCDRLSGPLSERYACGRPMTWHDNGPADRLSGVWACPFHRVVLTGLEAAERAGFAPMVIQTEAA